MSSNGEVSQLSESAAGGEEQESNGGIRIDAKDSYTNIQSSALQPVTTMASTIAPAATAEQNKKGATLAFASGNLSRGSLPASKGKQTIAPRPTVQVPTMNSIAPVPLGLHPLATSAFPPSALGFLTTPAVMPTTLALSGLPPIAASMSLKKHATSSIFENRKLRSGKWIPEEERYAELLVSLFEKGLLPNCEHGATLRSYLSQQLHCAPMRISKKFAGKGIGKLVFLSKADAGIITPQSEQQRIEREIKNLEKKFYDAVFPGNDFLAAFESLHSVAGVQPPVNFPGFLGLVPTASLTPSLAPALHTLAPACTADTAPAPLAAAPTTAVTGATGSPAFTSHAQQLQMSYIKALSQQKKSSQPAPATQTTATLPIGCTGAPQHSTMQRVTPMPTNATPKQQPWMQVVATPVPASIGQSSMMPPARRQPANGEKNQVPTSSCPSQATNGELPDFLSGFEKVAAAAKAPPNEGSKSSDPSLQQYSPPFTSRSFDDFHRLLGKDLTLGEPASSDSSPQSPSSRGATTIDENASVRHAMAQFTAESYAFFAQETCIAASQHDAYLSRAPGAPAMPRRRSFDVEATVNMISEEVRGHVPPQKQEQQRNKDTSELIIPRQPEVTPPEEEYASSGGEGLTPVERFQGSRPLHHMVSGSETTTSTSGSGNDTSSARNSNRSSNSEGNTSDDNKSEEDNSGLSMSSNDSDFSSDEGPKRKKTRTSKPKHSLASQCYHHKHAGAMGQSRRDDSRNANNS